MNLLVRIFILTAFLPFGKRAVCQNPFRLVFETKICIDSLYYAEGVISSDRINFKWNEDDDSSVALVYYNRDKSFTINVFKRNIRNVFYRSLTVKIPNTFSPYNPDDQMVYGMSIEHLLFKGSTLWIHHDSRFLVKVGLNNQLDSVLNVDNIDIRTTLNTSFKFIYPNNKEQGSFVGMIPTSPSVCPANPDDLLRDYGIYRFALSDNIPSKIAQMDSFDGEFAYFILFSPISYHNEKLFIISALTHQFHMFSMKSGELELQYVSGLDSFVNDIDSISLIRKNITSPFQLRRFYPLHFYHRICGITDSSVYILREYWPDRSSVTYFMDKIVRTGEKTWRLDSSVDLGKSVFLSSDNFETNWSLYSIPVSQIEVTGNYFVRLVVEPTKYDFRLAHEYKEILFQVFEK